MAVFSVDSDAVIAGTATVRGTIERLQAESTAMMAQLTQLQSTWTGSASVAFHGVVDQWRATKPLRDKQVVATPAEGTVYVIAGGAGAELYPSGTEPFTQYSESTHCGSVLRVRREQLTFDTYRADGTMIPAGFTKSKP